MISDPLHQNLLLYIDPARPAVESGWRLVQWSASCGKEMLSETCANVIYCFERSQLFSYLLFPGRFRQAWGGRRVRKVLYLNDGLLSSIFDAGQGRAYRAFASRHLAPARGLRRRLLALLPLALRAEKRYVVVTAAGERTAGCCAEERELSGQDFMFFSNLQGKLVLTSAGTLACGEGMVVKTSSCAEYLQKMEKEFRTVERLACQGYPLAVPRPGRRFLLAGRTFYTEGYVKGKSLRKELHDLSRKEDTEAILLLLARLDAWFERYRLGFTGKPVPLMESYRHLFETFSGRYGGEAMADAVAGFARQALSELSAQHPGVPQITAHNDLWPDNLLITADSVVAVDWERAVENRAPFFDYFWMMISSVLEHLVCHAGAGDYAGAFRLFLEERDEVSRQGRGWLNAFLRRLGLGEERLSLFLLLFLMELSVQGALALGRPTTMDSLAFGELKSFAERLGLK